MNRVHIALACGLIFAVFYAVTQSLGSFLVLSTDILFVIVSGVTRVEYEDHVV
jgi:hypothetical protein